MVSDETREKWKNKLHAIELAIEENNLEVNEWEEEFLDTISQLLSKNKDLSFKQSKCLNKICERL